MDKFKGLNSITVEQRKLFEQIPNKRKRAGKRAHILFYRKLKSYNNFSYVAKFLNIEHPCPKGIQFKMFFEVSLGHRIADCIIVTLSGETINCYIIELKTCMSNSDTMTLPIRQIQRLQGTSQLSDSVKYLQTFSPNGTTECAIIPLLLFKTQKSLKTIFSEIISFSINRTYTSHKKLINFLSTRQDVSVSTLLNIHTTKLPSSGLHAKKYWTGQGASNMGPKQKKFFACKQAFSRRCAKTGDKTQI